MSGLWCPLPGGKKPISCRFSVGFALSFLSVTSVPKLRWSSPKAFTLKPPLVSVVFLVAGLVVFGLGESLLVTAGVGVSP